MDELNQIQNPNVTPSQMPSMSQMPMKKNNYLFPVTVGVLVTVGAFAWWYIGQMNNGPVAVNQPEIKINQDAREDALIIKSVGEVDMGNLDTEFQAVDSDINSL